MAVYGFNRERAGTLRRIADREGLKSRVTDKSRYPGFIDDDAGIWIGQADEDIPQGSDGTFNIFTGTPGSETDSGDDLENCYNRTRDIVEDEWCQVVRINGHLYISPLGC